jgi:ureidoglycolate hydrolase
VSKPRTVTLRAEPLTEASWEPFGFLPVADTDPRDATRDLEFVWGDSHLNVIGHAPDEVEHTDGGLVCTVMYRHDTHTQALMPLNCDSVVAVAPASVDFSEPEHLDTVRAFVLHPLEPFVLARGTWHWGPFPLGSQPVQLYNIQGKRYSEDNASVSLPDARGVVLEVVV